MKQLAHATKSTSASPRQIYALWSDIDNWHTFDDGIEWAKLDGPFRQGATYRIKPKGGPTVRASVVQDSSPTRFVDRSHLFGAELEFDHKISTDATGTIVEIAITMSGPMSWFWSRILGKDQQSDLEKSISKLVETAEQE